MRERERERERERNNNNLKKQSINKNMRVGVKVRTIRCELEYEETVESEDTRQYLLSSWKEVDVLKMIEQK